MILPINVISWKYMQLKYDNSFLLSSVNRENDWMLLCRGFAWAIPWPIFREEIRRIKFNRSNERESAECKEYNIHVSERFEN